MEHVPGTVVRWSEAAEHGLTQGRLRSSGWQAVSQGLHLRLAGEVPFRTHCLAVSRAMPAGTPYSHWTAARLLGLWIPSPPAWLPLMATRPPGVIRPERAGLYVARARAGLVPSLQLQDGLLVVRPEICVAQLAEDLRLVDLVIAIDSAMHLYEVDVDRILARVRPRQRGLPVLRDALTLADGRSESAWETVLRLVHVASGIQVEPQHLIRDASGLIVARGDLRIAGTRRIPEYDGADHRDRLRHEADLAREKLLARLGLERYGYIKDELVHHPEMVVRDAERALGLPYAPGRTAEWRAWARESATVSNDGRSLLFKRLRRYVKPLRGRGQRRT